MWKILFLLNLSMTKQDQSQNIHCTSGWLSTELLITQHFEWQPFKRPLNYINWELSAPNNWQGNQRCVGLHTLYSDRFGKWNDNNCDRLYYSLCMKPKGDLSPNILLVKISHKIHMAHMFLRAPQIGRTQFRSSQFRRAHLVDPTFVDHPIWSIPFW